MALAFTFLAERSAARAEDEPLSFIRSVRSGSWSAAATWQGGNVPAAGARVRICRGHTVVYDLDSQPPIRMIHVAGTLKFATDRDTRLDVGLILIQPGETASESGFDCDTHAPELKPGEPRPALEVGSPERTIAPHHTALIRLVYFPGMDKESCPAIVCCGGRMDFHGAPMNRTWVKLGDTAKKGDRRITLAEPVTGWHVGDRIIITATRLTHDIGQEAAGYSTEERKIEKIGDGNTITLDRPLAREHLGAGEYRGAVANLSRNVIVESADRKWRGHTMYHRGSAGAISYAEFRHLGKQSVLGRYALHYHLVGDTMRGSYVTGASIWDSANRWLTIHGTNYLVVRDCVGYQSIGHGFYLEDGTEVFNVLDRNLAVQAFSGKRLPKQILPFDQNEGAGFWWANSLNTFTRNVSCENHRYGYRFEATRTSIFNLTLPVMQPDGKRRPVDIRTLPFVRFEGNEAVCDGLYGFNLGEGVERAGPDRRHPFIIRNMKIWEVHYAFRPQSPNVLVENMQIHKAAYGVYHPNYDNHVYRNLLISATDTEPFNRGHDDASVQYGKLAVDGLTFAKIRSGDHMPLIQISDDNPTGTAESHFRNLKLVDWTGSKRRAVVNLGGGPRPKPKTEKAVPVIVHDWFGPGRDARIVSTRSRELTEDGLPYREEPLLTGDESRAAEVKGVSFPNLLDPLDDLPPATIITHVVRKGNGWIVRGTTTDNGEVKRVVVNGREAKRLVDNFAQWEAVLDQRAVARGEIAAYAEDTAGNVETLRHVIFAQETVR
jgi:hypothetical protein